MELKVGDLVRTEAGQKGTILVLTKDGKSAYVLVGDEKRQGTYTYWLDELTKIDESNETPSRHVPVE